MANTNSPAGALTGLCRKAVDYVEAMAALLNRGGEGIAEGDWAHLESLIDTAAFQCVGRFAKDHLESVDWPAYKAHVAHFAAYVDLKVSVRRATETGGLVFLELREDNYYRGIVDATNTVRVLSFTPAGLIDHLDIYVEKLEERQA